MERFRQALFAQVRSIRVAVASRPDVRQYVQVDHPILQWSVKQPASVLNRFRIHGGGGGGGGGLRSFHRRCGEDRSHVLRGSGRKPSSRCMASASPRKPSFRSTPGVNETQIVENLLPSHWQGSLRLEPPTRCSRPRADLPTCLTSPKQCLGTSRKTLFYVLKTTGVRAKELYGFNCGSRRRRVDGAADPRQPGRDHASSASASAGDTVGPEDKLQRQGDNL